MVWVVRQNADFLVDEHGKILGRVSATNYCVHHAEAIFADDRSNSLGDYISNETARLAVEKSSKNLGLDDA